MTRQPRLLAIAVLSMSLFGACSTDRLNAPAEGSGSGVGALISASVQVPVAAPGAEVAVRFVNGASTLIAVNTCLRRVERREGSVWVLLPEELRLCMARMDVVPAQSEATATTDVPLDASPGEYRFRFSMTQPTGPAVDVITPAFRVE